MSHAVSNPSPRSDEPGPSGGGEPAISKHEPIFDLTGIDLGACRADKEEIARWNPHRGVMALVDKVVWLSDDLTRGVGLKRIRDDEFWVPGHFPGKPMYPGVLMIESAAQFASYMFSFRKGAPTLAAFLRIEDAAFRNMVVPGDDLVILNQNVRMQRKRFVCRVQGLVGMGTRAERVAFDATVSGMAIE